MYHSLAPGVTTPTWEWAVSLSRFKEQLDFLQTEGWHSVTFSELAAGSPSLHSRSVAITFDDGFADNLAGAEELALRNMHATWFLVSAKLGQSAGWNPSSNYSGPLMAPEDARHLRNIGMEIGSHTRNHVQLTTAPVHEQVSEIAGSKAELEDILGDGITSFAYPFGKWNDACERTVVSAGYCCACTTRSGWALLDNYPFRVRRLAIMADDSLGHFARKLGFADNDVRWSRIMRYYGNRVASRLGLGRRNS